ncbi:TPR REGION domain-containing protein [Citrus sinensis]|uniref:TPR REGION domain-containing protein n=1 Tax=Citrus sinensis TaxID=2711 RepID=A0ACB8KI61_CITSI|nr:TPR REGION domain-containing protein [Citrus sinensis]
MVTKTEETQLNRLENQVDNGGGGAWEYLCLVKKLKVRRPDKVLRHGLSILNDPKKRSALGPDGRLEGILLEAKGLWAEAEKAYSSLLEDNPLDPVLHKRRVAIAKAQGNFPTAIEWLNKFMADHDAWRELAEIYVSLQMYKQAAFCYEELILSQPTVPLYHLAYADVSASSIGVITIARLMRNFHLYSGFCGREISEVHKDPVLYTLGGVENILLAKKYYASAIDLTGGKNTKALFGICLCSSAIAQLTKGRNKEDKESPELQSLAAAALEKDYKQRAPAKLLLLTSALKSLKTS